VLGKERAWARLILIAAYLANIAFGGLVGMMGGFVAARQINQRLRAGHKHADSERVA
jgi:hypothetical protein